jgi:hypothetical protein
LLATQSDLPLTAEVGLRRVKKTLGYMLLY